MFDNLGRAEQIACVRVARDGAQCELLATAANHDRLMRLLDRLGFENRVLDAKVFAVKLSPTLNSE